jgi:hypothetical protein
MSDYTPHGKTKVILDRAMEHIRGVPYQVSVRWVFYNLYQEGYFTGGEKKNHPEDYYKKKKMKDYQKFVALISRARKAWYDGWTPETLADDTRKMDLFESDGGIPDPNLEILVRREQIEAEESIAFYRDQAENYVHVFSYAIDPNYMQERFCVVMYEARAMHQQFQYYTKGLTLCPFGGQPSIPYKWKIAKYIEEQCKRYGKDAIVLYFGDCDDAGMLIFNAGKEDITSWCDADVEFVRCGLTEKQAKKYGVVENFEHPGSYQWEALNDKQAKEIILDGISQYYDFELSKLAAKKAAEISNYVNEVVNDGL